MNREFKPQKLPFIFIHIFWIAFVSLILLAVYVSLALIVTLPPIVFWGIPVLLLLVIGFAYLQACVVYKKRRYLFQDDRIIQYSGGIFSDSQTELLIKNITHIKRVYPFIEYGLFRTGHIRVETAGSQESEVKVASVDNVEELMNLIEDSMSRNGFDLGREDLKYTEKPHPLGAFFEVFKSFLITALIIGYIFFDVIFELSDSQGFQTFLESGGLGLLVILAALLLLALLTWSVFRFLDLLKREYKIYSNIITYTEGFLNKHYAFIPFKNLSDSATTQTIVDRIFDLYDVKLSAQGSGHEVLFKNLKRGKEISETLDDLIDNYREPDEAPAEPRPGVSSRPEEAGAAPKEERRADFSRYETEFTADFQMNMTRHFFPLLVYLPLLVAGIAFPVLLLPAVIILLANFIPLLLQAKFTRFYVKKKGMLRHYKFITVKDIEFTNTKITGAVIKRNFVDYWFNTATVRFYSIGAGNNLEFTHMDYDPEFMDRIVGKVALKPEQEVFTINSHFSFFESLKAGFFWMIAIVLIVVVWLVFVGSIFGLTQAIIPLVLVAVIWGVIYIYQVFYYRFSEVVFYEDVVYFQKGIFFKSFYYARYDNIKDITTTKYPFSREGDLRFNIAGEKVVKTQQGKSIQSHHFTIKYVPDIPVQDELIDFILLRRPHPDQIKGYLKSPKEYAGQSLTIKRPSLKNPLLVTILILVAPNALVLFLIASATQVSNIIILLAILLVLLDILLLGAVVLYTRVKRYIIEDTRVLARWGVFFRKQTSIVFEKIDFLNNHQGLINKICGNGDITVNTVGSSKPELRIRNLNDYQEFYQELQKVYKNFDLNGQKSDQGQG